MKAYKNCFWRYLGRHKFGLPEITNRWPESKSFEYKRRCVRCGLNQEISVTWGFHFLEKETGGK